jgi:hypothetical protein
MADCDRHGAGGRGWRPRAGDPLSRAREVHRHDVKALDIDYAPRSRRQDEAIVLLRSGDVRVTTPDGTNLRFRG